MAAPTLQAEGVLEKVTAGALAIAIPTHQADDILIVAWGFWGPNSTSLPNAAVPSGWAEIAQFDAPANDGKIGYFWMRAPAASQTITISRPSGWDTGTDTCWGGRAYVIRGCITTGDPWDEADPTVGYTAANQPVDALTVLGTERLAIHFLVKCDDFVTAPTVSGWTAGTQLETTTGTDHSQGSFRKDNVSANTGADVSTVESPAAGAYYAFLGISFKPPSAQTFYQSLPVTAVGVAALSRVSTRYRSLVVVALGVATLSKALVYSKTLAAIAVGVVILSRVPTYVISLAATAVGLATLARVATFYRSLSATAVGTPAMAKGMFKTLAATATGNAVLTTVYTAVRSLSATAVAVAAITTSFIGGAAATITSLRRFF